jgi:hypothetical protein
MTPQQAREWMLCQWNADEDGTDLDWEALLDAHEALLGRLPDEDEDAFGNLKRHIQANPEPQPTTPT